MTPEMEDSLRERYDLPRVFTKHELCEAMAQSMVGKSIEVVKLGEYSPMKDERAVRFVPLPEYGIGLVEEL